MLFIHGAIFADLGGWPSITPNAERLRGLDRLQRGGIDGLNAGDAGSAEQMRALFGAGMRPLAAQRLEQLDAADLSNTKIRAATQLGAPFKIYAAMPTLPGRGGQADCRAAPAAGKPGDDPVSAALRAQALHLGPPCQRLRRGALDGADHSGLLSKCCSKQPSGVGVAAILVGHRHSMFHAARYSGASLDGGCRMASLPLQGVFATQRTGEAHTALRTSWLSSRGCLQRGRAGTSRICPREPADRARRRAARFSYADLRRRPSRRHPEGVTDSVRSRPDAPLRPPTVYGCGLDTRLGTRRPLPDYHYYVRSPKWPV